MHRLMDVMTLFSVVLLLLVLISVRRAHIRVEYSVSWLVAGFVLLVLSRSPAIVQSLSLFLGIEYPPIAILLIVFCIFLVVFYRFSLRISALKDANVALAQRLAILEYRLKSSYEDQETPENR